MVPDQLNPRSIAGDLLDELAEKNHVTAMVYRAVRAHRSGVTIRKPEIIGERVAAVPMLPSLAHHDKVRMLAGKKPVYLKELSRRLRSADDKIGGLVLLDVPGRIARLLVDLAEESGTNLIEKSLTHQTIAQMIGASRETVSRAMKDFQDAGWIEVERRRISLANRPALEHRAQVRE